MSHINEITDFRPDACWLILPEPLAQTRAFSSVVDWLDWELAGQLSRVVHSWRLRPAPTTTVVPTLRSKPVPYIVLQQKWNVSDFQATCEGLKLRRVCVVGACPADVEFGSDREVRLVSE